MRFDLLQFVIKHLPCRVKFQRVSDFILGIELHENFTKGYIPRLEDERNHPIACKRHPREAGFKATCFPMKSNP
jgi:hypothetical protein